MHHVGTNLFCGYATVDIYGIGIYLQGAYTYVYIKYK